MAEGITLADGSFSRLRARREGGRWMARLIDLRAFNEISLNAAVRPDRVTYGVPCPESAAAERKRGEAVMAELRRIGAA
jgi:hypothetical protein